MAVQHDHTVGQGVRAIDKQFRAVYNYLHWLGSHFHAGADRVGSRSGWLSKMIIWLAEGSELSTSRLELFLITCTVWAAYYRYVLMGLGAGTDEVWMTVQDDHVAGQGIRGMDKQFGIVSNHLHWLGSLFQASADRVGSRC